MSIICFGDSNTYGYDPRSYLGGRYGGSERWVDILGAKTQRQVENRGLNGREIPRSGADCAGEGCELFLVMVGTNDLLRGCSAHETGVRMERFLTTLSPAPRRILLLAPPVLQRGEWVSGERLIEESEKLEGVYRALAERLGADFAAAGRLELCYDGVHLSEEGHRQLAEKLCAVLRKQA